MKIPHSLFDPRSKLATILFASLLITFQFPDIILILYVTLLFILYLLHREFHSGLLFYSVFLMVFSFNHFWIADINESWAMILSFFLLTIIRLLPALMAATLMLRQTKVSQWIAALRKCRVPHTLLIPLTVMFRFLPTLKENYRDLKNAMKYRGISSHFLENIRHPIQTLEYIVVPLLMSVDKISLDLSASALVRGLGNHEKKSSLYDIRFHWQDYLLLIALVVLTLGGFLID